jgi:NAD(P)H dehydrogenase (quinone)
MSSSALVIAANGRVARRVVASLADAGRAPTALVRNGPKADELLRDRYGDPTYAKLAVGELSDAALLDSLLADTEVAFLALGSSPAQISMEKVVIDAAKRTSQAHLVKLSAGYAKRNSPVSVLRVHAEIEDHLASSGVPHTLISPASFMDIIFLAAPEIRRTGAWTGAAGDGGNALIDSQDVVDSAVEVILNPAKRGKSYVLTGPEALPWSAVAARLGNMLGRQVEYRPVSVADRIAQLTALGFDPWRVELLIGLDEVNRNSIYALPTTDFEDLMGKRPRGIDAFLRSNRTLFETVA